MKSMALPSKFHTFDSVISYKRAKGAHVPDACPRNEYSNGSHL